MNVCDIIARLVISPKFKKHQFDDGILDWITGMVKTIQGKYTAIDCERADKKILKMPLVNI